MTDLVDSTVAVDADMLREVVLSSECAGALGALERPLLRMGSHVALEMLEPLERALAELVSANENLFALLKIAAFRPRRLVSLSLDAGERTDFTLVGPWCISFVPVDRRFRDR
jgi:hypothetical protein